jgi:hypothetical protein
MNFNTKVNIIYLDLDGVLADFDAFLMQEMGRTFPHSVGPVGDKEMWNFLMTIPELYFRLPPTECCFELWNLAHQLSERVEILTALPRRSTIPTAENDKLRWVEKYFGSQAIVNFGPHSRDKWKHAKPGDILVDDRVSNIHEWETMGKGIGILHTDFENTESKLKLFTQK